MGGSIIALPLAGALAAFMFALHATKPSGTTNRPKIR